MTLVEVLPPEEARRPLERDDPLLGALAARRRVPVPPWRPPAGAAALLAGVPRSAAFLAQPGALAAVRDILRAGAFDVAFVEFSLLAEYGRLLREARVPAVLAEQELLSRRWEREGRGTADPRRALPARTLAPLWRAYEARALRRFADLWTISPQERDYAAERLRLPDAYLFPNVVDPDAFAPGARAPDPETAAFFGNFAHRPNADGLLWLLREVWPRVRAERPGAVLRVYGRDADAALRRAIARAGGQWRGFAPDLREAAAAAAAHLCPMVSGGGMRGKVLEALASGRPVVATPVGAEGVEVRAGLRIAPDARRFAEALLSLWRAPEAALEEGRWAAEEVRLRYGTEPVFTRAEARLAEVAERRESP